MDETGTENQSERGSAAASRLAHIHGIARAAPADGLPETFPQAIRHTAERFADRGIQLLDRSGTRADRRSYAELLDAVGRAAGRWRALGIEPGDRLLLCLPTSWDFVEIWLGAICMGALPAAIAPVMGGLSSASNFAERLEKYRSVIDAKLIVTGERMAEELRAEQAEGLGQWARSVESVQAQAPANAALRDPDPEETAFLQFTSGSTGVPRAVMITHRMATHNAFAINEGIGARYGAPASEVAELHNSWLPMHHDMGLVGCLLFAIANGIELSLMNPTTFLARPLNYLKAAHGLRAMLSGPNFGYQFCVDRLKPEDFAGLDLSQVKVAMTGSEMIRPETMEAFCRLARPSGFTPDKIMPCYGMAEATLAVTFDRQGAGVRARPTPQRSGFALEDKEVVCVGVPVPDTEVRIAAPAGNTLGEGELGEVLVKGPAVFHGYFRDPEASQEALSGQWLRTGDLGFIADQELYIAGRFKEILVIRGENIMPHEIEWLAEEARGETTGGERIAAFSVAKPAAGEQIVLVVEVNDAEPETLQALDRSIRSRVGRGMSLPVEDLVFVRRGRIPRTSSGKLQRGKIKSDYLNGKIDRLPF